jgi:hypothetical protein
VKSILTCIFFLFTHLAIGQTICKPTVTVKVRLCNTWISSDSTCPKCQHCKPGLNPVNNDYVIESYTLTAGGQGFDNDIYEAQGRGAELNTTAVMNILRGAGPGSFVLFDCIKAKYKDGRTYVLQPLFIEL